MTAHAPTSGRLRSLAELVLTVVIVLGAAFLIQAFLVKPYRIPTGSMLPTLQPGQRILVSRVSRNPHVGDVVVFHPPAGAEASRCGAPGEGISAAETARAAPCDRSSGGESAQTYVKRVVGLPGDVLRITDGHVYRNGVRERDGYIAACGRAPACTFTHSITVPPGMYYMMGDNRGDSDDSRYWGPVPHRWIIGTAILTYWPPDRIGIR